MEKYYYIALLLAVSVPTLVGYMTWEARTLDISVLTIEGAPQDIVFIADPHLRERNLDHIYAVIDEINRLNPSIVLIGGDFVSDKEMDFSQQTVWSEIDAPVYAVLGNHDYRSSTDAVGWMSKTLAQRGANLNPDEYDVSSLRDDTTDIAFADALEAELEANGVEVLRNEYRMLDIRGQKLLLVGVDDGWAGMADPPAVPDTDAYTLYLIHEPQCRADWDADLILAGHTHGGQFIPPLVTALNDHEIVELSGLKQKNGPLTYITRGVCGSSFAGMDLRFNARPEIVIINPSTSAPGA
jgi:predicted MPP superfamily phosphohydrolase